MDQEGDPDDPRRLTEQEKEHAEDYQGSQGRLEPDPGPVVFDLPDRFRELAVAEMRAVAASLTAGLWNATNRNSTDVVTPVLLSVAFRFVSEVPRLAVDVSAVTNESML